MTIRILIPYAHIKAVCAAKYCTYLPPYTWFKSRTSTDRLRVFPPDQHNVTSVPQRSADPLETSNIISLRPNISCKRQYTECKLETGTEYHLQHVYHFDFDFFNSAPDTSLSPSALCLFPMLSARTPPPPPLLEGLAGASGNLLLTVINSLSANGESSTPEAPVPRPRDP